MKNTLLFTVLVLAFIKVKANTYYFSSSEGNDNRNTREAQQAPTPWRSLQKLQQVFFMLRPGDSVLFKRGDVFYGSLNITRSGNNSAWIVFAAYGSGSQPVITGLTTAGNWSAVGNNIWESAIPSTPGRVNTVLVNGSPTPIGRYPNTSADNGGYLNIESATANTTITGASAPGNNLTGGEVVIRKNHWVLDRNPIVGSFGRYINYISESGYWAAAGYGYFIQNHASTLDLPHEWYFNTWTNRLGMLFSQSPSGSTVQASTVDRLMTIRGEGYLIFQDLSFTGADEYAFDIDRADHIQIKQCSILYTGNTAVHVTNTQHVWIEQVTIDYSNNIACDISNTSNLTLLNNTISNTGTVPGSGKGDSGSYEALLLSGDNQVITGNTISNTGYIPITFNGNNVYILNNFISRYGFVKDDGGGIYTWNNSWNAPTHRDRTIDGNIVLDGVGAPEGTADKQRQMHGIYMDDNTDHVTIKNNTIAHNSQYGIYVHNAYHLWIDSNTVFNNTAQVGLIHDNIAPNVPIRNITFINNILVSKTASQRVAIFRSLANDLPYMGRFDYNYYSRPLDEQTPIDASWGSGWSFFDLAGWQQYSKMDANSKKTPATIPAYQINSLGFNKYRNGEFNSNIADLYGYAAAGNGFVSWAGNSPLNGGALKIAFSWITGRRQKASVIVGIGTVKKGQQYLLRYEVAGAANRYIESYLRKSGSPYTDVSERKQSLVAGKRVLVEELFTVTEPENNASIGLDIEEQSATLYIDNLQLYEANVNFINPDEYIRFVYNKNNTPETFPLNGNYIDVREHVYEGSITLPPFRSAILFKRNQQLLPVTLRN